MLVTPSNFFGILNELEAHHEFGIDTETTGLAWEDRLFSISVASPVNDYYFDFSNTLGRSYLEYLKPFFLKGWNTFYIANAKFDLGMLSKEGIDIGGKVVCISSIERVIKNNYFPVTEYNLNSLAKRYLGEEKSRAVEQYITEHKLYTKKKIPGKKKEDKILHFDKVPLEIIQPYAEKDARLHYNVGIRQKDRLEELDRQWADDFGNFKFISENEIKLTKTCYKMEETGVKVDPIYTEAALEYEQKIIISKQVEFKKITGFEFTDSPKLFAQIFSRLGIPLAHTDKGNPTFNADALENVRHPVAALIKEIRTAEKKVSTYYSSFLYLRDKDDVIHPSLNQAGTETGRFSCSNPNLQNIPKEEGSEDPFLVRSCFVPRDEFCLLSIDYRQMEFRLLLDYAGEYKVIKMINDGYDPHQAVADMTGLPRSVAKTIGFGILYGMGVDKLSISLGVTRLEAEQMREQYFSSLRRVKHFIDEVGRKARSRQWVRNCFGRIYFLKDKEFSYILLNHLIQGGCADIVKIAMNRCQDFLKLCKSRLILQVHDELVFELHKDELELAPHLSEIMDNVYAPKEGIKILTSTKHSWKSWGDRDLTKGDPCSNTQKTEKLKTSLCPIVTLST